MRGQRNKQRVPDVLMATAHLEERRETRYTVPIEIDVSGIDCGGKVFHERTFTRNVSEWGCGFLLSVELKMDDLIALRVASRAPEKRAQAGQSLFQVRHVERHDTGWLVGAWKMDSENLWGANLEEIGEPDEAAVESRRQRTTKPDEHARKDKDR
jgi:hypothetical protein